METPRFENEKAASAYFDALLRPHFARMHEVHCTLGENRLKLDYLCWPREGTEFPHPYFGVEIKRGFDKGGEYTAALAQCVHYANVTLVDKRLADSELFGKRLGNVFLFPGMPESFRDDIGGMGWVHRFAGLLHVGVIHEDRWQGLYFSTCADRIWSAKYGAIRRKHNSRDLVGSGVARR